MDTLVSSKLAAMKRSLGVTFSSPGKNISNIFTRSRFKSVPMPTRTSSTPSSFFISREISMSVTES